MLYPLGFVFSNAFFTDQGFTLIFFRLMLSSRPIRWSLANSVNLGHDRDLVYDLAQPSFGFSFRTLRFSGKVAVNGLILIPLVPPFRRGHWHAPAARAFWIDQSIVALHRCHWISPSTGWAGVLPL